jgi:hypothetical protein
VGFALYAILNNTESTFKIPWQSSKCIDNIMIAAPCNIGWDNMVGDDRVRLTNDSATVAATFSKNPKPTIITPNSLIRVTVDGKILRPNTASLTGSVIGSDSSTQQRMRNRARRS